MASKFYISEELLAYVLDLPKGARLGGVERVPCGDGKARYALTITDVEWPERMVDLVYSQDENGIVALTDVLPYDEKE